MAAETIGFAVQPEDKPELERLVQKYGNGNRSAFLREAIRTMAARDRAERLDELGQSFARTLHKKWHRPLEPDERTALTQLFYKAGDRDFTPEVDAIAARVRAGEDVDLVAEFETLAGRR